jgi:hypothetical protein
LRKSYSFNGTIKVTPPVGNQSETEYTICGAMIIESREKENRRSLIKASGDQDEKR